MKFLPFIGLSLVFDQSQNGQGCSVNYNQSPFRRFSMKTSTPPDCEVNFAGIDYHKKFSFVTLGDAKGRVVGTHRLLNDKEAVKRFFSAYPGITCALESCRGYEWFLDYLKQLGLNVRLVNAYRTKLIAQSRCKTDKVDSRILMELLAIGFLPTCYQPTPEERQLRERLRWRAHLVRLTTRTKLQIHSLLDKENLGLSIPKLFSLEGRALLAQVQLSSDRQLLLQQQLSMLDYFESAVGAEDQWARQTVKSLPEAKLLTSIPGIGDLTSLLIIAELGDVSRFKSTAQVASYVGLVPSIRSSADTCRIGPITKQGCPHLRWMLVQCAWQAIRYSLPLKLHFASVSKRCGRNAGIISVARKLIQIAFRVLRDRKEFAPSLVGSQT
jgi:transposase